MIFHDIEKNLVEMIHMLQPQNIYFPTGESSEDVFNHIYREENWLKWTDSSGKDEPPPDFYCDDLRFMMEVMRVDDHSHKNKKGKLINPTTSKERTLEKELRNSGIMDNFPQAQLLITTATDLPTEQDHNFAFYRKNFTRIVEGHKSKIEQYRKNHTGYELIFFVFDESTGYYLDNGKQEPHYWFYDAEFLKVIDNSDIDYFVWYTPYKQLLYQDGEKVLRLPLPELCFFEVQAIAETIKTISYDEKFMVSTEE